MRSFTSRSLFLILVASALPVLAQTTGTVVGKVLDSKGVPVVGATVRLSGEGIQGNQRNGNPVRGQPCYCQRSHQWRIWTI